MKGLGLVGYILKKFKIPEFLIILINIILSIIFTFLLMAVLF